MLDIYSLWYYYYHMVIEKPHRLKQLGANQKGGEKCLENLLKRGGLIGG